MSDWKMGSAKELIAVLRVSGNVWGQTGKLGGQYLSLHKTEIIGKLRKLQHDHQCVWKIAGNPEATARHATNRRSVIIYLGG